MILVQRAFEDDGDVVQAAVDLDVASRPDIVALFRIVAVVTFPRVGERDAQIRTRINAGPMFSACRSGRPVVEHDIQKTRFIKNLKRGRPACEATAEGCTPEEMERWAGIQ